MGCVDSILSLLRNTEERRGSVSVRGFDSSTMIKSTNCDALFLRGAGIGKAFAPALLTRAPPEGWQRYCHQLWENPKGQFQYKLGSLKLRICHGNLLNHLQGVDAVVNSANKSLVGPARPEYWMFSNYASQSVEEVIHKAAGPELLDYCKQLDFRGGEGIRCSVGRARATPGTDSLLPAGFVIHAVAPGWHAMDTTGPKLKETWRCSLDIVTELGLKVVVAPGLGCGTNRTPLEDAAFCAFHTLRDWSNESRDYALELRLVLHTFDAWKVWNAFAWDMFSR